MSEWIPVAERLPDDHQQVLVWVPFQQGGGCKLLYSYWHRDDDGPPGKCWQDDENDRVEGYPPSHWMPLPPPPSAVPSIK